MWLIFGGSGFLGSVLRRHLKARNIPFHSPTSNQCDIRDKNALRRWIDEVAPEVVINCVALTGVDFCEEHPNEAWEINTRAPAIMAALCQEKNSFFVHFSTDYVFSGSKGNPYVESDLTDPINVYGWTKRLSEEALQAIYPESCLIIRTAWLFSDGTKGFFTYLAAALEESREKLDVPHQEGSPTYVEDLAKVTLNLIERRRPGLFHVVNEGSASWVELAEFFLARFPRGQTLNVSEREVDTRPARRPVYSVLATDKLRETADIDIRPWAAAAEECIEKMIGRRKEPL
ncbi:MAG: dTDP-4-dehydrorhamnose reductase [Deltaproteobacteria bacterium]|nr:dTDP-4-dehydrorhamnose reductase [Deltaproteobacteria bacterium]